MIILSQSNIVSMLGLPPIDMGTGRTLETQDLVRNYWQEYIHWYIFIRKSVEIQKWLTPQALTELKLWKKYRIHNQNYFY